MYTYDHAGRLDTMTDPVGNSWTHEYDLRGRQVEAIDPDRGQTTFTHDDAGQLLTTTHVGLGQTLAYVYDNLGRNTELREGTPAGSLRAAWSYDTLAKGQITSSTRYAGSAAYTVAVTGYDDGYRPLGQSVTLPSTGVPAGEEAIAGIYTTQYTYTIDGSPKTVKHPATGNLGVETVTTFYDGLGVPEWMGGGFGWGVYVSGSLYSHLGEPLMYDLSNSYAEMLNFDYETGTRRPARAWLVREGIAGYDLDVEYSYDAAGNITSIVDQPTGDPVDAQCFRYDALRRLTEAWTPANADCEPNPTVAGLGGPAAYWTSYTHDPVGNRLTETQHAAGGDTTRTYSYPAPGQPRPHALTEIGETGPGGAATLRYGYDAAGNTTCRPAGPSSNACPSGAGSQTLAWDVEGRLATITPAGGSPASFVYTADGDRLLRREDGVTTVYLPGGQELRLVVATGSKTTQRYYAFNGATVAIRTGTGFAGVTTLVSDHHGTAEIAIHNTSRLLTQRRHDPYGNLRGGVPASWPGDHDFLGKTKDATGLTHLGAREYDSLIGRFISVDPLMDLLDPQHWHGYSYANNNPVTLTDPDGLDPGGGQRVDDLNGWGLPKPPNGGGIGSSATGDYNVENEKKEAVASFNNYTEDAPVCQLNPGVCELMRQQVAEGEDVRWAYQYLQCQHLGGDDYNNCMSGIPSSSADLIEIIKELSGYNDVMGCINLEWKACGSLAIDIALTLIGIGLVRKFSKLDNIATSCRVVPNSFTGDTLVLMADGTTKAITEVREGDWVLAHDPVTGATEPKQVLATIIGTGEKHMVTITVDTDGDRGDATGTVTSTANHPFWSENDARWTDADDLAFLDYLRSSTGHEVLVIGAATSTATLTVYNLTVADLHTYYVLAGDTPVLVHNTGPCGTSLDDAISRGARTTSNFDEVARRLAQNHGIDPNVASDRLHAIKQANGLGGADNVVFDLTGNVWDPRTGDYLGSLTQGGAGSYVP